GGGGGGRRRGRRPGRDPPRASRLRPLPWRPGPRGGDGMGGGVRGRPPVPGGRLRVAVPPCGRALPLGTRVAMMTTLTRKVGLPKQAGRVSRSAGRRRGGRARRAAPPRGDGGGGVCGLVRETLPNPVA